MQGTVPHPTVAGAARNVVLAARATGTDTDLESEEHHKGCLEDILDEIGLSDTEKHGIAADFHQLAGSRASSKKSVDCACRVAEQDCSNRHTVSYLTRNRHFKAASAVLGEDRLAGPCHSEECGEKGTMDEDLESPSIRRTLPMEDFNVLGGEVSQFQNLKELSA
jgi:hypothetical protein